jgi:hypothetical protein
MSFQALEGYIFILDTVRILAICIATVRVRSAEVAQLCAAVMCLYPTTFPSQRVAPKPLVLNTGYREVPKASLERNIEIETNRLVVIGCNLTGGMQRSGSSLRRVRHWWEFRFRQFGRHPVT